MIPAYTYTWALHHISVHASARPVLRLRTVQENKQQMPIVATPPLPLNSLTASRAKFRHPMCVFSGANSSVVFSLFTLSDVLSERLRHHGLNYDGNDRVIPDVVLLVHVERISMSLCLRFDISLQAASFWDETILFCTKILLSWY